MRHIVFAVLVCACAPRLYVCPTVSEEVKQAESFWKKFSFHLVMPDEIVEAYFNFSLQTKNFPLARSIIQEYSLDKNYFDRAVVEGLAAQYFEEVLSFEPWGGHSGADYREEILDRVLEINEEWVVIRFVNERYGLFSYIQKKSWAERSFLHALRRNDFVLATEITDKYGSQEFGKWAIRLAFELALQNKDADNAMYLAKRWHFDKNDLRRVTMLYVEKKAEEARKKKEDSRQRKKRECESSKDWNVGRCK